MDPFLNKNLITTKDAGELSGYSSDYLSRLVRSGKIVGKKIGHSWLIDKDSLTSFLEKQGTHKINRARSLADERAREYRAHRSLLHRATKTLTTPVRVPRALDIATAPIRSQVLALSVAALVVVSGALMAHASTIPRLASGTAAIVREVADGFVATFGDIPARIVARIAAAEKEASLIPSRIALSNKISTAHIASPLLARPDMSLLHMEVPNMRRAVFAASVSTLSADAIVTIDDIRAFAVGTYGLIISPARAADVLAHAYAALGERAYSGVNWSFSAYDSFIEALGTKTLALAAVTRDILAASPKIVARIPLALGDSIIAATHAAIRVDVALAYIPAATAPKVSALALRGAREGARTTIAFIGGTGDALVGAAASAARIPSRIALALSALGDAGPSVARTVFSVEYAGAARFIAATDAVTGGYALILRALGTVGYESARNTRNIAGALGKSDFPKAAQDAYLGLLGKSALALDTLAKTPILAPAVNASLSGLAAVITATRPALSAGEQVALATYEVIHGFINSTGNALAFLFGQTPSVTTSPPLPAPQHLTVATSSPVSRGSTLNPNPQGRTSGNTTYTTVVQASPSGSVALGGISQDFMNQSLTSLRSEILATVSGMISPVSRQVVQNITTIQEVNRIEKLHDLIVINGDFRGGTFSSGVSVAATSGTFTTLTGGTTSLGNTTVTGNLTVSGTLTPGTVAAGTSISAPYFTATSTTATSTFAGPFALGGNATTTTDGTFTTNGRIGIGTTTPGYNLAVEGSSSLGNQAIAGYFTATTSTATSTFAGHLAVGTSTPSGNYLFLVGTSTPLLHVSSNTGYIGIGTSTPDQLLSLYSATTPSLEFSAASGPINKWTMGIDTADGNKFKIASSTAVGTNPRLTIDGNGNIGIGTTSPDAMLSFQQTANGTPFISAYRITDTSPSGDFINYKMKDGTTLFRVDNSGNLLAGGIINSGSQTITSTSQPQFRVQYDASNEITFSTGSTGTTTLAISGSSPSLAFTPQSNSVSTFNFTNAASNSILSIDTANQRVGVGTTTPYSKLSVWGAGSSTNRLFELTNSASTTLASILENGTAYFLGNVGLASTSPSALLAVHGNSYVSGTSFFGGAITATSTITASATTTALNFIASGLGAAAAPAYTFTGDLTTGFWSPAASTLAWSTGGTERMRLNATGNFGIGTSTPIAKLALAGGSFFQAGGDATSAFTASMVGGVDMGVQGNALFVSDRYAYVAANSASGNDLHIYDVTDPTTPVSVGGADLGVAAQAVYVSGHYAYVGTAVNASGNELRIFDIARPAAPSELGGAEFGASTLSMVVSGRYLYVLTLVNASGSEFKIYDIANPKNPVEVGSAELGTSGTSIFVAGRYAYVTTSSVAGNDFRVFDVSNPTAPTLVGGADMSIAGNGVYVSGRYAYVVTSAVAGNDFKVFDVKDPTTPTEVGGVDLGIAANGIYVSGRYAYLTLSAVTGNEFRIFDLASSTAPVEIGGAEIGTNGNEVQVVGRYAYVVNSSIAGNEFRIYDITGAEVQSMLAHSLEAGNLQVRNDISAQGQLSISGGANFGQGGLFSQGPGQFLSFATSSLASVHALSAFAADSNTASVVDVFNIGHLASSTALNGIGTGLLFSAQNSSGTTTSIGRIASVFTANGGAATTSALTFSTLSGYSLSEAMRLDSNGNVGVGTTSPFAKLSLAGSAGGITNLFALSTSTALFATTTALTINSNGDLALLNGANLSVGGSLTITGTQTYTGLSTFTNGFLSNASSTITSGLFTMSGGASTTNLTASGTGYFETATTTSLIVSGTPTFQSLSGFLASNGTSGTAARTLTGTANQITISNGDGIAGNPTFSLPSLVSLTNASSSQLSVTSQAWFGGTATSTFDSAGALTLITPLLVTSGGTGATTLTGLLQGNSTGAVTGITGTAGQFPYYNGASTLLATSTIFVSTASNVGIGTTTPSVKFSVGGAAGDTSGHGYFSGGLGVGMVNTVAGTFQTSGAATFGGSLTVSGLCVTGDTRLRRRRKAKRGEEAEADEEGYIYDEVAIMDIKEGDEIQSLDEKTGKLVWSRVKQLAYMGKKQTYKLVTASGKQIRTTANHPYLARKTTNPECGARGTVTRSIVTHAFIDASNIHKGAEANGWEVDYLKLRNYLVTRYEVSKILFFGSTSNDPERILLHENIRKMGYEVLLVPTKRFADGKLKADVDSRMTFEMMRLEEAYDQVVVITGDGDFYWVLEYLLAVKSEVKLFGFARRTARDLKRLFGENFADLGRLKSLLQADRNENGAPVTDTPVFRATDAFDGSIAGVRKGYSQQDEMSTKCVDNPIKAGEGSWRKVSELKEGMEVAIAVNVGAGEDARAVWEKIISVEPVAEEDVYDVEIEGTHNFIGNDIVAHNTALFNQASTTQLSATSKAYFGGTATSTFDSAGALTLAAPLAVTSGGTGWANIQAGAIPYGAGTGVLATTTQGTGGQVLAWSGSIPAWVATTSIPLAGDVGGTLSATAIGANKVTLGMLATLAANSVIGNLTGSAATPTAVATSSLFTWTGTGLVVRDTSPSFTTPALGTPSALVLTNATGLPVAGGGTGAATLTGLLQGNGTSAVTSITGTAGQFPYYNGASTLLATSTIFLATSGNIGIGTSSPQSRLAVSGGLSVGADYNVAAPTNGAIIQGNVGIGTTDTTGYKLSVFGGDIKVLSSAADPRVLIGDSTSAGDYGEIGWTSAGDYIRIGTQAGGVSTMVINESGNVGIGTTTPSAKLNIKGGLNPLILEPTGSGTDGVSLTMGYSGISFNSTAASYKQFNILNALNDSGAHLYLGTGGASQAVTIDNSGNVGIGTTNPAYAKLQIKDTNASAPGAGGFNAAGILLQNADTGTSIATGFKSIDGNSNQDLAAIYFLQTGQTAGDETADMTFWTSNSGDSGSSEKMRILSSGNVGIGTTGPGTTLDVTKAGADANYGMLVLRDTTTAGAGVGGVMSFAGYKTAQTNYGIFAKIKGLKENVTAADEKGYLSFETNTGSAYSEVMRVTSTGNVGIGTTGPGSTLDVRAAAVSLNVQSTTGTNTAYQSFINTGGTMYVGLDNSAGSAFVAGGSAYGAVFNHQGNYPMQFGTNNLYRMTILGNGNVGIGTTGPAAKLHLTGTGENGWLAQFISTGTTDANGLLLSAGDDASEYSLKVTDKTGLTTGLAVKANGNVGIGTTVPGAKLGVQYVDDNTASILIQHPNEAHLLRLGWNGSDYSYINTANGVRPLVLQNTGGNVGIGTTSPATLLEVGGAAANVTFDFYKSCAGFTSNANGLLACTASDERLKQDVITLATTTGLTAINALRPVSFYWNPAADRGSGQQYGLVAQEVQSVFPNLVAVSSPTALTPGGTLSLNYEGLIAPMILAIQELDARTRQILGADGVLSIAPGVESQCVVGDTRLRRRKRDGPGAELDWVYDDVPIRDIVPGDEIQSLDEATGRVVYSRVNALVDMGEQEVYELVTRSGRRIRTTSNHPFLARRPRADFDTAPAAASL